MGKDCDSMQLIFALSFLTKCFSNPWITIFIIQRESPLHEVSIQVKIYHSLKSTENAITYYILILQVRACKQEYEL